MNIDAVQMEVPFVDLGTQHHELESELLDVFKSVLSSGSFIGGAEVVAFEQEFAAWVGTPTAIGLSSGTDALRLILLALGLRQGDEVITVPNTFIATTEAITQAGGAIRFVDVSEGPLTMDPAQLEAAVSEHTVGIVPVHLFGQVADMDAIRDVANRHGLWVIEDACQAHGAVYKGQRAGSLATAAAFSFYPGKNLGALGDGGAATTASQSLASLVRRLREHGQSQKYIHESEGYTARLDALQAAFLRVKLRRLDAWTGSRCTVATWYRDALSEVPQIRLPTEAAPGQHAYHLFVIHAQQRDALREHLRVHGVATGLHYPVPLHLQQAYAHLNLRPGTFRVAEEAAANGLSLPMFPEMIPTQVEYVAQLIKSFYSRRSSDSEKGLV